MTARTSPSPPRLAGVQVDGLRNPHVQTVFLEDMPIHSAAFASGGAQVRVGVSRQAGRHS